MNCRISPPSKFSFIKLLNCLIMNQKKYPIYEEVGAITFFHGRNLQSL